jgi:cytoskeleton protein RodZ
MNDSAIAEKRIVEPGQLVAGQMLAQQREKLGLTEEECAESLKLSPSKIKALETGDDRPFASEMFIRGYLRNYAKLLRLSEDEIISSYCSHQGEAHLKKGEDSLSSKEKISKWWLPYLIGIIIVIAWFAVSDYLDEQRKLAANQELSAEIQSESSIALDLTDKLISVVASEDPKDSLVATEVTADTVNDVSAIGSAVTSELQVDVEPTETNTVEQGVDIPPSEGPSLIDPSAVENLESTNVVPNQQKEIVQDELLFTFAEACWVEITDASDKTIVSSLRQANSQLQVQGAAPFAIILGNISGTTLRFNGEAVALSNSRDGRTLRLTVGS